MAAMSTLQSVYVQYDTQPPTSYEHAHQHGFHEERDTTSTIHSLLRTSSVTRSADILFTQHTSPHRYTSDEFIATWMDPGFEQAPTDPDGEVVWYCTHCGDGPYGDWQPACAVCFEKK